MNNTEKPLTIPFPGWKSPIKDTDNNQEKIQKTLGKSIDKLTSTDFEAVRTFVGVGIPFFTGKEYA